ncbi:MAG: tRNA 2-thiocytidine(32) synthetase TtcA [Gammaproteobacteria bacterium]|nr:MAG: tRNA 2-thiocytidine(32) synthetase TtcA [Gammaproteobacteria bacterium]
MAASSKVEKKLMHYIGKAIADYSMIQHGDRLMLCLSGGKDSFTLLHLLHKMKIRAHLKFELLSFTLDQSQPGWDDTGLRDWLEQRGYQYDILKKDTYSIVIDKIPEGKTYCSLCSRLRRGNIYAYAERNGYNKIALGHHRDDLIESLLMSILYSGRISSMPPKLLTDNKKHVVIRPMAYCQEDDIREYAEQQQFPIIPCNLCGSQQNMTRAKVKDLIRNLAEENPKIPGNILASLGNVSLTQLMDHRHQDFRGLDEELEMVFDEVREAAQSCI